jgi:uncharacterized phosphosugar-binding protein
MIWFTRIVLLVLAASLGTGVMPTAPVLADAVETSATAPADAGVLSRYRDRLPALRAQIPAITAAAEVVAKRWVDHQPMLLHYPFGGDANNFTMEMISRAGGLDNAQLTTMRQPLRTEHDVYVVAPRSWEKGGAFLAQGLPEARQRGWLTVVFASKQGMPEDAAIDLLIDNHAPAGDDSHAAVNQIVNITNGWLWTCELTAALTRLGHHPGILKGMALPGATAHNERYQHSDMVPVLYDWDQPIPAGKLAELYLDAIERELAMLEGKAMQDQIARAADLAAQRVRDGGTLWASSFTHVLDGEVFVNNRSPIKAFRGISTGPNGETFTDNLKKGDLLLFFGEWTLNLPWLDYLAIIRSTGADYIPSFRVGSEPLEPMEGDDVFYDLRVDDALMVLNQPWPVENAVVDIPFPPGRMAPVSGVHVCLLYRMLDEAIAERLAPKQ